MNGGAGGRGSGWSGRFRNGKFEDNSNEFLFLEDFRTSLEIVS